MAAALEAVQTAYGKAEDYVTASPVATYYATYSGGMPLGHFMLEWAPLLATIIFPVLCLVFAGIGLCAKKQTAPTVHRIVKRVGLAVRARVSPVTTSQRLSWHACWASFNACANNTSGIPSSFKRLCIRTTA